MTMHTDMTTLRTDTLLAAADAAARAVPPAWPLDACVAVNPFLGQTREPLAHAAARLARVTGAAITMPRQWYLDQIAAGTITDGDLAAALAAAPRASRPATVAALKDEAARPAGAAAPIPTVADLAARVSGIDWPGLIADRFGAFASSYFDEGQALWPAPRDRGAFAAWRAVAVHDLTPEVTGLKGFAAHVARSPETAREAISQAVEKLTLADGSLAAFFHRLLMTLGGWSMYGRYRLWQAELKDGFDPVLTDLLAIRIVWEDALFARYGGQIEAEWAKARAAYAEPVKPSPGQIVDAILQEAAERSAQRGLAAVFAAPGKPAAADRPAIQAGFCIDVRSEIFRRALEAQTPHIQTIGFAGFFGLGAAHRRFASDVRELRLPVLLNPGVTSSTGTPAQRELDLAARYAARAKRAWGRFKLSAVSSFAFVEATGPVYAGKLVRDALGFGSPETPDPEAPRFDPALPPDARAATAEAVLRAMSLTENFARLVVLLGHGASVVNNPHASTLHCGACGGYAGDVNARLLAGLLNDREVRAALKPKGIDIPGDTLFVGGLHDTTTDLITLFEADSPSMAHAGDLSAARRLFAAAGKATRTERAKRLPHAAGEADIAARSRDWSQVRPEWALAGCKAFIAAPRARTLGKSLEGRAFLHDYAWEKDAPNGYGVLELIITAPVVVASWISLQYYGSSVAPEIFGGGNKLLHNVCGGIGVFEGNGGPLRAGLPWQSVHDGEKLMHEPLRLSVAIEAPIEAMTAILARHDEVRALFDNGWLHLFQIGPDGTLAARYAGDLEWVAFDAPRARAAAKAA